MGVLAMLLAAISIAAMINWLGKGVVATPAQVRTTEILSLVQNIGAVVAILWCAFMVGQRWGWV